MKLEIGKEYMTRSGFKVKVYDIAGFGDYPVIAGLFVAGKVWAKEYAIDGTYSNHENSLDIIGEWQEPLDFDWSCLPAWCNNYIAMDSDGRWFAYSNKPAYNIEHWRFEGEYCKISKDYAPKNFTGDWDNSLFKNPNIPCES